MLYLTDSDPWAQALCGNVREHVERSGNTAEEILGYLKRRLDNWGSTSVDAAPDAKRRRLAAAAAAELSAELVAEEAKEIEAEGLPELPEADQPYHWPCQPYSKLPYSSADVERAQELIDQQLRLGRWKKVEARSLRAPQVSGLGCDKSNEPCITIWMEFIDDAKAKTYDAKKELALAGYTHWAGSTRAGWNGEWQTPDGTLVGRGGMGKRIYDVGRKELLEEQCEYNRAKPHPSGSGWIFRGAIYTASAHPNASSFGPRGLAGPRWGSAWCGD